MQILLVHQNFPGQFRELAPAWLARGHQVMAVGCTPAERFQQPPWDQLRYFPYHCAASGRHALALETHLRRLRDSQHLLPEVVVAHSAWGEAMPIKRIWPEASLVVYPELWGSERSLGVGYDPLQPNLSPAERITIRRQNRLTARALQQADAVVTPTTFQRNTFPSRWREPIEVIHEGVDCNRLQPNANASLLLPNGQQLSRCDRVISYVSRHLEPLRGLRTFLAALPPLLAADPQLQVVMVGGHGHGYGPAAAHPEGHLAEQLQTLPPDVDLSRVHQVGPLPYPELCALLQLTSAHVYLTYPYALSWSLIEAMACAAPVVGNHSGPLDDVLLDGHNGLLINFNDPGQLSAALARLLADPALQQRLGAAARQTVQQDYGLELALERYEQLFNQLRPPATG
jgi:glycosyltransferase involved in cell wall biosynthesis